MTRRSGTQRLSARQLLGRRPQDAVPTLDLLAWTEAHRVIRGQPMVVPGPLRQIYGDDSPRVVFKKAAQIGASEYLINASLWVAATGYAGRGNSVYVLPTADQGHEFVGARVLPAIEESPYLSALAADPGATAPASRELRKVGTGYVYYFGAGSRPRLREVAADLVVLDEYEDLEPWVEPLVAHRLDSSDAPLMRIVGTPRFPGSGIDRLYEAGSQQRYHLTCDRCGREDYIDWDNVLLSGERDDLSTVASIRCVGCQADLADVIERAWERGEGGRWIAGRPEAPHASYQLSQLYVPRTLRTRPHGEQPLAAIARALASSNPDEVQEAWNQNLAEAHAPAGRQLTHGDLRRLCNAKITFASLGKPARCVIGVDVGKILHVVVLAEVGHLPTLVDARTVANFRELGALIAFYDPQRCVIDAAPELHALTELRERFGDVIYSCRYVPGREPPEWTTEYDGRGNLVRDPQRRYEVEVDRTSAMDRTMAWLLGEPDTAVGWAPRVAFPGNAAAVPELFDQLTAPVRLLEERRARYDSRHRPDHYFHAMVYAHLAWQERDGTPGLPEFYPGEEHVAAPSIIGGWHPIGSISEAFGRW